MSVSTDIRQNTHTLLGHGLWHQLHVFSASRTPMSVCISAENVAG